MRTSPAIMLILAVCCLAAWADTDQLVITEIMYNSPGSPDVEFVEIMNHTDVAVDLTGFYLLDDNSEHDPCMLSGTLEPCEVLVIANDPDLFSSAYPGVNNVNPVYFEADLGWGLSNGGEWIQIYNASDEIVDQVTYDDENGWPEEADGDGASLELIDPSLDNTLPESWEAVADGGTPGVYPCGPSAVENGNWGTIKTLFR